MKKFSFDIPFMRKVSDLLTLKIRKRENKFTHSANYWDDRYRSGGNSGSGSYNKFAEFKASVLNSFVEENNISKVIEFGCGDGNQLLLSDYPSYVGFDVSKKAISICEDLFKFDDSKKFLLNPDKPVEHAELSLSLDVIFHLVEDDVYDKYMRQLFESSNKFVIIYSSNTNQAISKEVDHVKHRKFSDWISLNQSEWRLIRQVPNEFPYTGDDKEGSFADFYIYGKG